MEKSTNFSAPKERYLLPLDKKKLCTGVYFRVKTTENDNKYYLHSRTCADG